MDGPVDLDENISRQVPLDVLDEDAAEGLMSEPVLWGCIGLQTERGDFSRSESLLLMDVSLREATRIADESGDLVLKQR